MARILKYQISSLSMYSSEVSILIPEQAVVRAVGMQHGQLYIWAEVQRGDLLTATRTFQVIPTGDDLPNGIYVGTVFDGPFVWHVYEVTS